MSVNALRVKFKKLRGNDKKADKQGSKADGRGDGGKRKHSSPAEPSKAAASNSQPHPRKGSLGTDSPVHSATGRTPTSPLVVSKSVSAAMDRRDSTPGMVAGSLSQLPMMMAPTSVPKVNVSFEEQPLDRQGIINITVDVQNFLAAISRLRKAMEESDAAENEALVELLTEPGSLQFDMQEPDSPSNSPVMSNLTDLIHVVHACLGQHQGMQSTEIKDAAKNVMNCFQTCSHQCASTCSPCNSAIENLIDAFTNSVQEYLMGEIEQHEPPQHGHRKNPTGGLSSALSSTNLLKGFSKSHDNLISRYSSCIDLSQQAFNEPIVDQIDQALSNTGNGVEVASAYVKVRMKYHREITGYLNKRAQIEARYQREMNKLARSTKMVLDELHAQEECLPLLELFRTSVDQDVRFATNCNTTYNLQVGSKLIDPMDQKITECERLKKDLTQTWQRELKKLAEAKSAMKSAKAKYRFLGQDLERVKSLLTMEPYGKQAEKRKKELSELEAKWQDSELAYKNAVAECNDCQYQVQVASQKSILCAYRRMIIDVDIALKSGLISYFQLQHNFFKTLPDPMYQNVLEVRGYEVGGDFMRYIKRHPEQLEEPEDFHFELYDPVADESGLMESPEPWTDHPRLPNSSSHDSPFLSADDPVHRANRAPSPQLSHAWDLNSLAVSDSQSSSASAASPRAEKKKARPRSMAFLLDPNFERDPSPKSTLTRRNSADHSQQPAPVVVKDGVSASPAISNPEEPVMNKIALTHSYFRKLRGPARCRECDAYVYFHGFECETCGLACHKKCLSTLAIRCGSRKLARKMNTFGVDFIKHLRATKRYIPIIVTKCIDEIDERGLDTMGLYRISSAKTKIEHLCQLFELGADRLDLSDRPPNLVGSCLKLYFRQLPEPILTFGLYHEYISFAREASHVLPCNLETASEEKSAMAHEMLERLKGLLQKLPYENYITLARLLYHLHRVGSPEHVKYNCMPHSNLGIVFGPNLLRQREMVASLALLADMTAQAKAIEILVAHVYEVFHVSEEQIMQQQEYDDSETTERLVDGAVDPTESLRSPQLEVDDAQTTGSRTPYNTPPERRRENVSELGEVLEVLQSVSFIGRRASQPIMSKQTLLADTRDNPHFSTTYPTLPGSLGSQSSEDMLTSLYRHLRPRSGTPNFEKMLTPVEERPAEGDSEDGAKSGGFSQSTEEGDDPIISSSSHKLDHTILSRSTSGVSNPSTGVGADMESEASSVSNFSPGGMGILSGGFTTPPRNILSSSRSLDGMPVQYGDHFKEDIAQLLSDENSRDAQDSSQGSNDSSPFSDNVKALLEDSRSPPISPRGASSAEGTPFRHATNFRRQRPLNERSRSFTMDSSDPAGTRHLQSKKLPNRVSADSPYSSAFSSASRETSSSQGSFSESPGGEGHRSSEPPPRKTNSYKRDRYAKYERYERSRSLEIPDVDIKTELADTSNWQSQTDSADNHDTLTGSSSNGDATVTGEDGSEPSKTPESVSVSVSVYCNGEVTQPTDEKNSSSHNGEIESLAEGGKQPQHSVYRGHQLKETHKQTDSGIDESGFDSASKTDSGIVETPDEDIPLPDDSKPLSSYAIVFASCESGLDDSPDPYSEEQLPPKLPPKLRKSTPKSVPEPTPEPPYLKKETSLVELFIPVDGQKPKLLPSRDKRSSRASTTSSDSTFDMGPTIAELEYGSIDEASEDESSLDAAPRQSKYSRVSNPEPQGIVTNPGIVANPLYEGTRGTDDLARLLDNFRDQSEVKTKDQDSPGSVHKETSATHSSPAYQIPKSLGAVNPTTYSSPTYSYPSITQSTVKHTTYSSPTYTYPGSASSDRPTPSGEEQRYTPLPLARSGPKTILSDLQETASPLDDHDLQPRSQSMYSIPRSAKPALRVLRITPNAQPPGVQASDRTSQHEIHIARLRMMSPEEAASEAPPTNNGGLRRSHSHDLLGMPGNANSTEQPTKVGSLFVVPESRRSKKTHDYSATTFKESPKLSPAGKAAYTVLVDVDRTRRVSIDSLSSSSPTTPKSPRNRKRSRTPQFV